MPELLFSLLSFVTITLVVVSLRDASIARVLLVLWVVKLVSMLILFRLTQPSLMLTFNFVSIVVGCGLVVSWHCAPHLMFWRR